MEDALVRGAGKVPLLALRPRSGDPDLRLGAVHEESERYQAHSVARSVVSLAAAVRVRSMLGFRETLLMQPRPSGHPALPSGPASGVHICGGRQR